jgi:hypothetical protein
VAVLGVTLTLIAVIAGIRNAVLLGRSACTTLCSARDTGPPPPPAAPAIPAPAPLATAPPAAPSAPDGQPEAEAEPEAEAGPEEPQDAWIGVAAATEADEIVAWSKRAIWSVAQHRLVLDGADEVMAVAVGGDGTVYAIRGDGWLGAASRAGGDRWRRGPLAGETLGLRDGSIRDGRMLSQLVGLQVTGPWLAWIMRSANDRKAYLALTGDQGRSWTVQLLPEGEGLEIEAGAIRVQADGRIDLLAAFYDQVDCGAREAGRFQGHLGSSAWRIARIPGSDDRSRILLLHSAREIGFGHDGRIRALSTVWGAGRTYAVRDGIDGDGGGGGGHDGSDGGEMSADRLVALSGGRETNLGAIPDDLTVMAVDHRGNPLAVGKGQAWRWSRDGGWQSLELPQPLGHDAAGRASR